MTRNERDRQQGNKERKKNMYSKRPRERQRNPKRVFSRERKGERKAQRGRNFEEVVFKILQQIQNKGHFKDVAYHAPNSTEDRAGKDFTVAIIIEGERVECSFGMTTSLHSREFARGRYPEVPQFHWPLNTKPETIQKRVLALFPERRTPTS